MPPADLVLGSRTISAQTRLWRVMIDQLGSTEPSTSTTPTRFTPVRDGAGSVVPALYLGDSLACALCETVLRGQGDSRVLTGRLESYRINTHRASELRLERDVVLADLRDQALVGIGLTRGDVITDPTRYPETVRWSQHVWDTTDHSGLVWNSYRNPGRLSYLLFVDPAERWTDRRWVRRRALSAGRPLVLNSAEGRLAVMRECRALNIVYV